MRLSAIVTRRYLRHAAFGTKMYLGLATDVIELCKQPMDMELSACKLK